MAPRPASCSARSPPPRIFSPSWRWAARALLPTTTASPKPRCADSGKRIAAIWGCEAREPVSASAQSLHRRLDVVVVHDLSPAGDFALEQRPRGSRRALVFNVGRNTGIGPRLHDRGIADDLLQRRIELLDDGIGRARRCEQRVPVENFELGAELLHETGSGGKLRRWLFRGDAVSLHLSGCDLLHHRLRGGGEQIHMAA